MDFFSTLNFSKEAELAYANWSAKLPDPRKTQMMSDMFSFGVESIKYNMKKENERKAEKEWKERFRRMKKKIGWTYGDMAKAMGGTSSGAIKASVSRKLPAYAKMTVCLYEKMNEDI